MMKKFCTFKKWVIIFLVGEMLYAESPSFIEGQLTGQLGNQLFVIAATVSLALDHDAIPVFPDFLFDKTNGIPLNFEKVFYHLNTTKPGDLYEYHEPFYHYAPIPYIENMRLCGYFQSEKYFKHHKEEILELFAPRLEIKEYIESKYKDLLLHPNIVSVHLRSYYDHDPSQEVFIQYGKEYCEKAMTLFPEDTLFVVFSNKMEQCKKELASINRPKVFIECESYYYDLYLMSLCKHNIICNSSFSWWAAYLNSNPEKIIVAPPRWYTPKSGLNDEDIVPEEWIRLRLDS